jgi:type II secretory pathway pseudopilin PulG
MPSRSAHARGATVVELLVVITVIALLMAGLFAAVSRVRDRTKKGEASNLMERIQNGLETYYMHFRCYPPHDYQGRTGSQSLYYFLFTPFRTAPDGSKGEVLASVNFGPLPPFDDRNLADPVKLGSKTIIDPWRSEIHYHLDYREFRDSIDNSKILETKNIPVIYSLGPNKIDDTALTPSNTKDDVYIGKQ